MEQLYRVLSELVEIICKSSPQIVCCDGSFTIARENIKLRQCYISGFYFCFHKKILEELIQSLGGL